jgi:uncharacterized BrkB/YihY/UPF0761 family membrane protein
MPLQQRADELRQTAVGELANTLYVRDRDAFASVLGSAIALRLFLFVVPANLALLAFVHLVGIDAALQGTVSSSITTGSVVDEFSSVTFGAALWTFITSFGFMLWAGRSLAQVLATGSTSAWQMPPRSARLTVRSALALSMLLFAIVAMGPVLQWVRDRGSIPLTVLGWVGVAALVTFGWFLMALTLPRPTKDPGALLPGVFVVGIGFTVLQWFMQFYLPRRIAETSDKFGDLASTLAALSYFFFVGRLIAGGLVLSAVSYERWGSLSMQLLELPGVRGLSARWPGVRRYFEQPTEAAEAGAHDERERAGRSAGQSPGDLDEDGVVQPEPHM